MSEMTQSSTVIPALTLGWRMQMSLRQSDLSVQSIADTLGVTRQTVGRWMADKGAPPRRAFVTQWAWLTRVPTGWLETGIAEPVGPDGGPVTTSGWSAEPLPFPDLLGAVPELGSHFGTGPAWQQPDTFLPLTGSTEPGLAVTRSNDQERFTSRAAAVDESSVEEIATSEKVAA